MAILPIDGGGPVASLDPFLSRTRIAYFSMEIAIRPEMHTYAGGLGILAGDTVRSCADLEVAIVFVTLASRAGYFRQIIDSAGNQQEAPDWWQPADWCLPLDSMIAIPIEGRPVWIRPWLYVHTAPHGHGVPILLLDTDLDQNRSADRQITHRLYGGDDAYRLKQEIVLGIGGVRMLRALGFDPRIHHLNEGHAALLALDLLSRRKVAPQNRTEGEPLYDIAEVRERCVFTTHTPVKAGHDRFSYELFARMLPEFIETATLRALAGEDQLNMTRLALNLSGYVNGVARRHAETTGHMFPGYRIHAITNGVHAATWAHPAFASLFSTHMPRWQHEPEILVRAQELQEDAVWRSHMIAKAALIELVRRETGIVLDVQKPIVAFARRMTNYKRPLLLFQDFDRLQSIAQKHPFQIIVAGKAHPADEGGKEAVRALHELGRRLSSTIAMVFMTDYEMEMAKCLIAGCDIWLNTPLPPMEASGTSGMKAALNGVLNFSVLDGWWIEACIEGVNGWAIGAESDADPVRQAEALYDKLGTAILPLYYGDRGRWQGMMKAAIATIAYYFNSHRMVRRYATEAYLE